MTGMTSKTDGNNLPPGHRSLLLLGETFAYLKPHPTVSTGHFMQHHISRHLPIDGNNLYVPYRTTHVFLILFLLAITRVTVITQGKHVKREQVAIRVAWTGEE
ncbi:hypothetical protein KSP40_PGU001253 [Platanthera guangdongensis]|uniref:Uncharacterized protein n=1 Tax=Platanthera guangdongensis TaxID=2320717 RepID=A0ABR2LKF7_9ASPA